MALRKKIKTQPSWALDSYVQTLAAALYFFLEDQHDYTYIGLRGKSPRQGRQPGLMLVTKMWIDNTVIRSEC